MRTDLDGMLGVVLAALALHLQHNLLGGLGLKLKWYMMRTHFQIHNCSHTFVLLLDRTSTEYS
jgi:hypothetical protein